MPKAQNPLPEADASEAEVCEEQTETKVRKFLDQRKEDFPWSMGYL